jgi:(p)ppGpp synthase/HD superfamily hydrolase
LSMSDRDRVAYTPLYEDALAYAAGLHAAHFRKGPDHGPRIPYIAHLLSVSSLVWEAIGTRVPGTDEPTNQDLAIAGLLHDAVEDQGGRPVLEEIRRRFGDHVARIVDECSDADQMPKPPWRERKEAHIAHMATASKGALVVIAADKLHNVTCMIDDYLTDGDELWERFDAPCKPGDIFWYYDEMHAALERRLGKIRLVNRVGEGITRLKNRGKTQKVASPS